MPVKAPSLEAKELIGPDSASDREPRTVVGKLGSIWVETLAYRQYFIELPDDSDPWDEGSVVIDPDTIEVIQER